jgi:internalin A
LSRRRRWEYGKLAALVKEHGDDILGEKDTHQYQLMKRFSRQIGDVLATVTDILQPRNFEDLESYGFLEGPGHGSNVEP